MNHKRKGPKSTRSGCLMCKPHKNQKLKDMLQYQTRQEKIARLQEAEQKDELMVSSELCPKCVHCGGDVCDLEDCEDHTEDCEIEEGKWVCSLSCYNANEIENYRTDIFAKRKL